MAHILNTVTRHQTRDVEFTDSNGNTQTKSEGVDLVHSVTFNDYAGVPHTLTFHPKGTIVSTDSEPFTRTVGDNVPYYEYTDPDQAVNDYLDGKV